MKKFDILAAVAAPMPKENIDTDQIIPARYLKTIQRSGLGKHLFAAQRYQEDGTENPDFVLNQTPYRAAEILITLDNFGCGSSREHAPWALLDFGIRCVIAPSFADIFFGNCFKNGILPIALPRALCDALMQDAQMGQNARVVVNLETQTIARPDGTVVPFDVDPFRKHLLLEGLDDIGQTLEKEQAIASFETRRQQANHWMPAIDMERLL